MWQQEEAELWLGEVKKPKYIYNGGFKQTAAVFAVIVLVTGLHQLNNKNSSLNCP